MDCIILYTNTAQLNINMETINNDLANNKYLEFLYWFQKQNSFVHHRFTTPAIQMSHLPTGDVDVTPDVWFDCLIWFGPNYSNQI